MNIKNVAITTSKDSKSEKTMLLVEELQKIIPDSIVGKEIEHKINIKVIEHNNKPLFIQITQNKMMLEFKIIEYKSMKDLRNKADPSSYFFPELIANNFNNKDGDLVFNLLIDLFPQNNVGNRIVNFSAKNDFIFFRMYRVQFGTNGQIDMQDVGPHITLRLRKVQDSNGCRFIDYRKVDYKDANEVL
ncbi:Ribosome production factor 1 [Binucleata daphniae]